MAEDDETDSSRSESTLVAPEASIPLGQKDSGEAQNPAVEPPPNGGSQAWLQVMGSFFLNFNSWGLVNSFGVFQTYYQVSLLSNESSSNISWIGSIQAFLLLAVGVATGPIYDMGHFNFLVRMGVFLMVFAMMMTSICTKYWQFMLAQAIVVGLGSGLTLIPSFALLTQYFTTRKALATGLAASGSSVGGIIYPVVFHKLQPKIGFPWATRVIAFIALGGMLISLIVMRLKMKPQDKIPLTEFAAFKEPPYTLFVIGLFFCFIGLYTPIFYIQSYAIDKGITDQNLGFYLLPFLNAASIFGRIGPNFFADKTGPLNILIPCVTSAGLLCLCWIGINNTPGIIVFAILYGFLSGAFVSLPITTIVTLSPHLGVIGTRMGMCFAIISLGVLARTPIAGAILNFTGEYTGTQAFAGSAIMLGSSFLIAARISKDGTKIVTKS